MSNRRVKKPSITLLAVVEKVIPGMDPHIPEKAQLLVEGADHLYKEVRIENTLEDADGKKVSLKPGAHVDVTIEAEPEVTTPKK